MTNTAAKSAPGEGLIWAFFSLPLLFVVLLLLIPVFFCWLIFRLKRPH